MDCIEIIAIEILDMTWGGNTKLRVLLHGDDRDAGADGLSSSRYLRWSLALSLEQHMVKSGCMTVSRKMALDGFFAVSARSNNR